MMGAVAEKKRVEKEFRWSVRRKADAVTRLLRGEDIHTVARELRIEAHRLAARRDEFISGGAEALKVVDYFGFVSASNASTISWINARSSATSSIVIAARLRFTRSPW